MKPPAFSARNAIIWGALAAGVLDLAAVCAFWAIFGRTPIDILQSIATARLGAPAFDGGAPAALIGLFLHFAISFVFASAYVVASSEMKILRARPLLFGVLYGFLAYVIMTFVVVPTSRATFGGSWPPPLLHLSASLFIHLFLFGLPIALAASRIDPEKDRGSPRKTRFAYGPAGAVLWGGLAAGVIEIIAVFAVWASRGRAPGDILQSIASAVLGPAAFEGGAGAAALGLFLHFLVSFIFAAGYVAVALRAVMLRDHPVLFGLVYGLVAHWIMSAIVVPLSLAGFGDALPSAASYARTLIVHMAFFGLPIALAASRIRRKAS